MASGQDIRITDVPFSNLPATTATVFINDNGKLRQTDLTTVAKNSELHTLIVGAHQTALDDIHATHEMHTEEWKRIHDHTLDAFQRASDQHVQTLDDKLNTSSDELSQLIEAGHEKLQDDIKVVDELCVYAATVRETTFEKNAQLTPTVPGNVIIGSVKGDSYQKQETRISKNLAKVNEFTADNTVYTLNLSEELKLNTLYHIQADVEVQVGELNGIHVSFGDASTTFPIVDGRISAIWDTSILSSTRDYLIFFPNDIPVGSGGKTVKFSNVMLTESDTEVAYEPYFEPQVSPSPAFPQEIESVGDSGSVVVKTVGKNLLKNTATTQTINGVTFTVNSDGSVTVNGTATHTTVFILNNSLTLSDGQYILSGCPSGGGSTSNYKLDIIKKSSVAVATDIGDDDVREFDTVETDALTVRIVFYNSGLTVNNLTFYPMIRVVSETDSEYQPYTESTITIPLSEPLRAIGDVKDEIVVQNGVYGVLRKISEKNLAELEWSMSTSYAYPIFYASISDKKIGSIDGLSNKFTFDAVNTSAYAFGNHGTDNTFAFVASNTQILVRCDAYTDVESFKEAMGDAVAQYELVTPVFEPFEDQTPFYELMAYDEVTNIEIVCGDNLNPSATVMYPSTESGVLLTSAYVDAKVLNQKLDEEVELRAQQVAGIDERLANEAYLRNEIGVACVANTTALNGYKLFACSQDVFDNMAEYDTNTLYIITE